MTVSGGFQGRAGGDGGAGDGGDAGKGLAPETQGTDVVQILLGDQFAGGMTLERQGHLGGRNTRAVVNYEDLVDTAGLDLHGNVTGGSVD